MGELKYFILMIQNNKRPIIDAKDINRKEILRLYLNFAYEDYWDWE